MGVVIVGVTAWVVDLRTGYAFWEMMAYANAGSDQRVSTRR